MEKVILSQIIKELVLENGEAVLPGFGVFGTEKVSAFFSDEGRKINPPTKKITFTENCEAVGEELLERVSSKLDESPSEMEKPLKEQMTALAEELKTSGNLVLEGFGTLSRRDGNIDFVPEGGKDFFAEMYAMEPILLRFAEHEPESEPEEEAEPVFELGEVPSPEGEPEPVVEPEPIPVTQTAPIMEAAEKRSRWFTVLIVILSIVILAAILFILGKNGAFDTLLYSDEELDLIKEYSKI